MYHSESMEYVSTTFKASNQFSLYIAIGFWLKKQPNPDSIMF